MSYPENNPVSDGQPIRVLIVDDHPLFRDGLARALEVNDFKIVGESKDGEEALANAYALRPDVVLLDVNLPGQNGLQVARRLTQDLHSTAVIVLTAYHDTQQVLHAMRAGASAYCSKDITPDDLVEIIRAVVSGLYIIGDLKMDRREKDLWISESIERMNPHASDPNEQYLPLSHREMEILEFVTRGLSNKEIAYKLQISQQTVKNHMTSILKKLNVEDRTQAAVKALRHGWVRLQDQS